MGDVFEQTNTPVPSTDKPATPEYRPLPTAEDLAEKPKKKEYSSDLDGVEKAAKDLTKAREEGRVPQAEAERVDRGYRWQSGLGEKVEDHYTLEARRAAEDLTRVRQGEAATANPLDTDRMTAAVDAMRRAYGRELPPDFIPNLQAHADQAQQQAQPQTEQPQVEQIQAQAPEQPAQDEWARLEQAWRITPPEVQAALWQELQQTEAVRAQYQQATWQAAQVSAAALLSFAPELVGIPTDQIGVAVSLIAKTNPGRAAEIQQQLSRTKALYDASIHAQQQQQRLQAQQLKQWVAAQDAEFDRAVTSKEARVDAQNYRRCCCTCPRIRVDREQLAHLWQSQPLMRSAPFQRMMVDAARFRAAQREVVNKLDRSTVPVQRPGVSQPRGDDSGVTAAMKAFRSDPNPKSAAALLMASRAANRR